MKIIIFATIVKKKEVMVGSMYYTDRASAGRELAGRLLPYRYENCVVVALSAGSVLVAEPIAEMLHCIMTLYLTEDIVLPGENSAIGSIDQEGGFTYNSDLSHGQIDEFVGEFLNYIEGQKLERLHHLNQLLGDGGIIDKDLLRDHVVIVVSDGLKNPTPLDAIANFLKPLRLQRLIITSPIASVKSVDRMHIVGDELQVLNVTDNYFDNNHYYDNNDVPSTQVIIKKINQIILNWH